MTYGYPPKSSPPAPVPATLAALQEKLDARYTGETALPPRLSAAALNATFVRFEDTNGNPLPSRNVVIKVDATTGEIIDIVSEA